MTEYNRKKNSSHNVPSEAVEENKKEKVRIKKKRRFLFKKKKLYPVLRKKITCDPCNGG